MSIKKGLLQFHVYLGLFCTPYLLIFALSSLSFNHVSFREEFTPIKNDTFQLHLNKASFENTQALGEAIADSLDLMGWFIPWESHIDSLGFLVNHRHLGRDYRLEGSWSAPEIIMTTNSTRFISRVKGLHGLHESISRAPWWINAWGYYQDLTVYSMLFWVLSGIWLWWISKTRSGQSTAWLLGGAGFSIILMIYLWLVG